MNTHPSLKQVCGTTGAGHWHPAGQGEMDPKTRLGVAGGVAGLKSHPWFEGLDFKVVMAKQYMPPVKPKVASADDTSNFDSYTQLGPMAHLFPLTVDQQRHEGQGALIAGSLDCEQNVISSDALNMLSMCTHNRPHINACHPYDTPGRTPVKTPGQEPAARGKRGVKGHCVNPAAARQGKGTIRLAMCAPQIRRGAKTAMQIELQLSSINRLTLALADLVLFDVVTRMRLGRLPDYAHAAVLKDDILLVRNDVLAASHMWLVVAEEDPEAVDRLPTEQFEFRGQVAPDHYPPIMRRLLF
ncbi:cAMP-dependent kinase catalytic subunit beta isoform X6 [Haematococcus lacustris]|uniref:cAMP-dependent kinase catalytic subunit beta isoform X6 n=1 Tax=Haematococcus lacustris TaxID=44745 RepID=A0A6A0AIL3_HAELA|nr:cAMP-dependent kinase catalytic subunit beta isoform X6 [Haematococcus lacustris]